MNEFQRKQDIKYFKSIKLITYPGDYEQNTWLKIGHQSQS